MAEAFEGLGSDGFFVDALRIERLDDPHVASAALTPYRDLEPYGGRAVRRS